MRKFSNYLSLSHLVDTEAHVVEARYNIGDAQETEARHNSKDKLVSRLLEVRRIRSAYIFMGKPDRIG